MSHIPSEGNREDTSFEPDVYERTAAFEKGWEEADNAPPEGAIRATQLLEQLPDLREPVIDGILRKGETLNIIGAPKAGKSWLILGLLVSVANGRPWLGHETTPGRILLIDNELHLETIAHRLRLVSSAMQAELNNIHVMSLRGKSCDVINLCERSASIKPKRYQMIAIDALYRALPQGISESDNAQMMRVYNTLDQIAGMTEAAIVVNHHTSKGSQDNKAITDVGSGAGAISRATDTHLTIRPHDNTDLCVLDGVCRNWAPFQSKSIRWSYPVWEVTCDTPALLRTGSGNSRQEKRNREGMDEILKHLSAEHGTSISAIRKATHFRLERVERLLGLLKHESRVRTKTVRNRKTGERRIKYWRILK